MSDKMSIRFDSSAYVLLKIIPGKIWFVFAEFIDNSISSYIQNRKELEKLNGPNFKLTIELSYSKGEDKITITDNASGIDEKNWIRALEPGNIPENNKGGNEFGMGMKFSAVWLCNKWKLESKNINESFERSVNWNYQNIINNKLEDLPFNKNYNPKIKHGTTITLTELEKNKLFPFQEANIKKHLSSIYRNFIRVGNSFLSKYKYDGNVEINAFGEVLKYEESEFLFEQNRSERDQFMTLKESPKIEWKYKFDMPVTNHKNGKKLQFSGFIGVLSKMKIGRNGFSYFRRGRVVQGSGDKKMFPKILSGSQGSPQYKRIFGEFHFDDLDGDIVESTFNKNAFQDEDFINQCIESLRHHVKALSFEEYPGKKFNLLSEAQRYLSGFDSKKTTKAIDEVNIKQISEENDPGRKEEIKEIINNIPSEEINNEDDIKFIDAEELPNPFYFERDNTCGIIYKFKFSYWKSINLDEKLYKLTTEKQDFVKKTQEIEIQLNLNHKIFYNNPSFRNDKKQLNLIVSFIKALCYSILVAKHKGMSDSHLVINNFNYSIESFLTD